MIPANVERPSPPPLATDLPRVTREFDPEVGREAFGIVEPTLRARDPDAVLVPNADPALSALVALVVHGFLLANLAKLASLFTGRTAAELVQELYNLAWSTWWLQTRVQSVVAIASGTRVDPALVSRGTTLRSRMIRVLDYHFAEDELMQAELADIRSGTGYHDLAVDLTRLDGHYLAHAAKLAVDTSFYDPNDPRSARETANGILTALRDTARAKDETIDLRNRSWTRLTEVYDTLKAASDFVFRDDPRSAAMVPALRAGVMAMSAKPRKAPATLPPPAEEAAAEDEPAPMSA